MFRHAGLDPASRHCPDQSREPFQRMDPGFHREPWIPAFAGMTILTEGVIYKQTLINYPLRGSASLLSYSGSLPIYRAGYGTPALSPSPLEQLPEEPWKETARLRVSS